MGRTPDYLNVTFACFAGRSEVWARRGNQVGAANLVAYQEFMRDADLSTTHALMNPQVDRTKPEAEQAMGQVALHKVGETPTDGIVVRGARMLATLAPFADELLVYPGSDIRPQDGRYALSFAIPIATPGLRFICRDSYSKQRDVYDYPLSARFDEMDAVVIFDDVEIPRERVFLDGDTVGYSEVITDTGLAQPHHASGVHAGVGQAVLRAGAGSSDRHDHGGRAVRPHPGEARADLVDERARALGDRRRRGGRRAGCRRGDDSGRAAVHRVAGRDAEVAAAGQRAAPADRGRRVHGDPVAGGHGRAASREIEQYFQAAGADAERRIRLFRLAWDFLGSELGGRGELYERFYLSGFVADDRARLQHRRQVVPRVAGRAVPTGLTLTPTALIIGGGTGIGAAVASRGWPATAIPCA